MAEPLEIKFNTPFDKAREAAQRRGIVLPSTYYGELPKQMRSLANTVSYIQSIEQIKTILDSVNAAIDSGNSFQKWRKEFNPEQFGITKAHAETVYRNALQTQYSIGRWEQAQAAKKNRPYLRYVTINDSRTSACCRALSGIIRPIDDPFWGSHTPPNHHNCRSIVVSLTEKEAQKRSPPMVGLNQPLSPQMQPQNGWDYNPALSHGKVLDDLLEAKITKLPNVIKSTAENKLKKSSDMKIITLEQFVPVQKIIAELAVKKPDWFPEGFNGIHAVERADMFAGYYQGVFYFSVADELVSGFKPAIDLANAIKKSGSTSALTFNEEYAIETLWHEITHAMTGVFAERLALGIEPLNEGIVQLSARHNYHKLADALAIKIQHQKEIILSGLAYPAVTRNLLELIEQSGVSGEQIEKLLLKHGNDYLNPLKELLSEGLNTKRVGTLLNSTTILTIDALKEKIKVQQKNAPLRRKE